MQSFYRLYPELDLKNYSFGRTLFFDNNGYFLLYNASDSVLMNLYQAYIARYDTNNNLQWIQPYIIGTAGSIPKSNFILTSDNYLAFCGYTWDNSEKDFIMKMYDKAETSNNNYRKGFIVKIDKETGVPLFMKTWGNGYPSYISFEELIETSDSGFIVVGATDSINPSKNYDLYIMKINNEGIKQWDTILPLNNTNSFVLSSIIKINNTYYFTVSKNRNPKIIDTQLIGLKENGTIVLNKKLVIGSFGKHMQGITKTKDNQLLLSGSMCNYY